MIPLIKPNTTEKLSDQADRIAALYNSFPPSERPEFFALEVTGIGEALAEALRDRHITVVPVARVACWENLQSVR